jgi:hypothetical protein
MLVSSANMVIVTYAGLLLPQPTNLSRKVELTQLFGICLYCSGSVDINTMNWVLVCQ